MDESDSAQVQAGRISQCRIAAMALQTLVHHPQENTQRRIERAFVALQAGWRQLSWPADDNYLGRFDAIAGRVLEAGYCEPIELQRRLTFCPARR